MWSRGHMTTATRWGSRLASRQHTTAALGVFEVAALLGRPERFNKTLDLAGFLQVATLKQIVKNI